MSNSKTDKIRERLEAINEYVEADNGGLLREEVVDKIEQLEPMLNALEAVVKVCEGVAIIDNRGRLVNRYLLDIIADELDVEEG